MGTMLFASGVPQRACLDELATTRPELVGSIHRAYLEAGADLVETATFGANRVRLAGFGLASETHRFNRAAARVAREARDVAGRDALVAGSVGPLGAPTRDLLRLDEARIREAFREQIDGLLEGGVDLLVLETFVDLRHLLIAVDEARRATADLPIVAQLTFGEELELADGSSPAAAAALLAAAPVDVIGVNCGAGPHACLEALEAFGPRPDLDRPDAPARSILPNAGLPQRIEGQFVYAAGPEYFGAMVPRMLDAGAAIVGGCCGTTPAHIAAMRVALDATSTATSTASTAAAPPPRPSDPRSRPRRRRRPRRPPRAAAADPAPRPAPRRPLRRSPSRSTRRARSGSTGRSRPPRSSATPALTSSTSATRRWPASGWARWPSRSGSSTTSTSSASSISRPATGT